jgi:hypothetical protein
MGQRWDRVYHYVYGPSHRDKGEGGKNELIGMSQESGKKQDVKFTIFGSCDHTAHRQ